MNHLKELFLRFDNSVHWEGVRYYFSEFPYFQIKIFREISMGIILLPVIEY